MWWERGDQKPPVADIWLCADAEQLCPETIWGQKGIWGDKTKQIVCGGSVYFMCTCICMYCTTRKHRDHTRKQKDRKSISNTNQHPLETLKPCYHVKSFIENQNWQMGREQFGDNLFGESISEKNSGKWQGETETTAEQQRKWNETEKSKTNLKESFLLQTHTAAAC